MSKYETRLHAHVDGIDPILSRANREQIANAELGMARILAFELGTRYPGFMWGVRVDHRINCALVNLAPIMRQDQVFLLRLDKLTGPNEIKYWMMISGGEILERFGLHRGAMQREKYLAVRDTRRVIPLHSKMPG